MPVTILVDDGHDSNVEFHAEHLEFSADLVKLFALIARLVTDNDTEVVNNNILAAKIVHMPNLVEDLDDRVSPKVIPDNNAVIIDSIIIISTELIFAYLCSYIG